MKKQFYYGIIRMILLIIFITSALLYHSFIPDNCQDNSIIKDIKFLSFIEMENLRGGTLDYCKPPCLCQWMDGWGEWHDCDMVPGAEYCDGEELGNYCFPGDDIHVCENCPRPQDYIDMPECD